MSVGVFRILSSTIARSRAALAHPQALSCLFASDVSFLFPSIPQNYHLDDEQLKPGKYALQAGFVGKGVSEDGANLGMKGIALMPYRLGKVTSNQVGFEISKAIIPGPPRGTR